MTVILQSSVFDPGATINEFQKQSINCGAIVSFTGVVRNNEESNLKKLHIEHYPSMTKIAIEEMINVANKRWKLSNCLVIHRYGNLKVNEIIMMVVTASSHRVDAFQAAEYLMDYLKSRAPFWKKEFTDKGSNWVLSKETDEAALTRW
ncbi:MAG: molybdenum cofactor biosynthesis protein MoaE [Paracoccaceae bacterium]|jgi:molybdopterin synthase catalytic subunit|nr:molybdenum cofactor biosynthesis protein MoaE [Paracoccaceae bacterium]